MKKDTALILFLSFLFFAVAYSILPSESRFAGSHSMYTVKNSTTTGDMDFCAKCHPDIAGNISNVSSPSNYKAHGEWSGCICHGYYPNYTALAGPYGGNVNVSINLKHNLTKNIYCTNCHVSYNSTGDLDIGNSRSGLNQSGHYITINRSNTTDIYERAYRYFNRSPFGPLG